MGDNTLDKTKIILVTDAWEPQVNGVVTTYKNIIKNLPDDYIIDVIHPGAFNNIKLPFYESVPFSIVSLSKMEKMLLEKMSTCKKTYFHIATEGSIGFQARRALTKLNYQYTSAYHTKFPEFIKKITNIPIVCTKWYFDWFHRNSKAVMCSSKSNANENSQWNSVVLKKGYDSTFYFRDKLSSELVLLYVGRVSKEKNIDDFCKLDIGDSIKIVVGDGPYLKELQNKYPEVRFVGYKFGRDLASFYQNADVCVFPSRVDTFGITILESMACGTPVAAYPVTGPIDQIINGINGWMDEDLEKAVIECLSVNRAQTAQSVLGFSWKNSALDFVKFVTY
jgi:glycosyltransferase involved in cell wall biosynthesis